MAHTHTTVTDLQKISPEDLQELLKKTRHALFKLQLEARTNQLKEVTKVKILKKEVARILTALQSMRKKTTAATTKKVTKKSTK